MVKTTLVRQLMDESWEYITFDDSAQAEVARADPVGFIRNLPSKRIALDEVQRVPETLLAIKQAVDENRTAGRFLLTGSANALVLPTVSDALVGRMEAVVEHLEAMAKLLQLVAVFSGKLVNLTELGRRLGLNRLTAGRSDQLPSRGSAGGAVGLREAGLMSYVDPFGSPDRSRMTPSTHSLTPTEARVLAAIDMDGLLDAISRLVAIPTDQGRETPAQEQMAEWMRAAGMEVDVWEIDFDELARHPRFSTEIERGRSLGVVGSLGRADGPGRSLILNGHVDVVPAGDESRWTVPPWQGTIRDGNLVGRGALDMKGALCCGLYAARAIAEAGVELDGRLLLESVIAEEDGGAGTLAAIQRGYTADGAVVIEPTRLSLAPAQGGALNFRIRVRGRSAHGALRTEGVSAIDSFIPIYRALQALEARRNSGVSDPLFAHYEVPFPLCVGTVRAGEWASNVPESLCFEGRYGVVVGEEPAEAQAMFEEAVAAAARTDPWLERYPPQVEWWGGQFHPAATDPSDPIVRTVAGAFRDVEGRDPRMEGMPYGADMQLLVNVGQTPTVMFGPGDVRNAHRPDEWVPISELETVTRTLALTALRFCGHGGKAG